MITGPQRRVLIVDDHDDLAEMLATALRHNGYDAETAASAHEALTKCRDHKFEIIISDIGMPEMNGYELARRLRTMPEHRSAVMVAVTGFSIYDDRNRALEAGFDELVTKPIAIGPFLSLIERLRAKQFRDG